MKEKEIGGLYRLVDGTQADPSDCEAGKDGVLRHKNGVPVALNGAGKPETIGEEAAMNAALTEAAGTDAPSGDDDDKPAKAGKSAKAKAD